MVLKRINMSNNFDRIIMGVLLISASAIGLLKSNLDEKIYHQPRYHFNTSANLASPFSRRYRTHDTTFKIGASSNQIPTSFVNLLYYDTRATSSGQKPDTCGGLKYISFSLGLNTCLVANFKVTDDSINPSGFTYVTSNSSSITVLTFDNDQSEPCSGIPSSSYVVPFGSCDNGEYTVLPPTTSLFGDMIGTASM